MREPGARSPEWDLQAAVDPDGFLGGTDRFRVVTLRGEDQRLYPRHLGDRGRPRTTTSPSLHGIQEPSSLIGSSETDEGLGCVRHDRLPVQRSQSAESRFGHDLRKPPIGRRGVAKRVVQHREGHLDRRSEPPVRRSLSDQLHLRPERPRGLDVAAHDMEMQARGKDVLVVRALTGLQEAGVRLARDPSRPLRGHQHRPRSRPARQGAAGCWPSRRSPGVLDQSLDPAAPLGCVAVVAEDPAELQVGVLEERHVVQRQVEDVCALQEVPPRSAEGAQPRSGVAERLELESAVAELLRQAQRQEHVETGAAPATPRQVADPGKAGMDRDPEPRIVDGHRHGPAEQGIRGIQVREHQGKDRPPGEYVTEGRTRRQLCGDEREDRVGALRVAGTEQVLGVSDASASTVFGRRPTASA